MDLVNIIYRYVNRFISSEELIETLENLDKENFSKEENEEIEKLIKEVKEVVKTVPIKIDQVEINRLTSINRLLDSLKDINFDKLEGKKEEETKKFIEDRRKSLLKDQEKVRDSGPRYEALYNCLVENKIYTKYCKNMNDLELLEFIT